MSVCIATTVKIIAWKKRTVLVILRCTTKTSFSTSKQNKRHEQLSSETFPTFQFGITVNSLRIRSFYLKITRTVPTQRKIFECMTPSIIELGSNSSLLRFSHDPPTSYIVDSFKNSKKLLYTLPLHKLDDVLYKDLINNKIPIFFIVKILLQPFSQIIQKLLQ